MSALVCGSYAFDTIMVFQDRFKNHILPDKVHMLNVSFLVPTMRREFGGCAGNISYNLNLLGGEVLPMATVGEDFSEYAQWMDSCGISRKHIKVLDNMYTGQAFITTDLDDNQITAFHPGAMGHSHKNKVDDARGVSIGIVSPDGREGMIQHAKQFADAGIPFIFDPGQGIPMFDGDDLLQFIKQANWLTLNNYEAQLMQERTGQSAEALAKDLDALIITLGAKGSLIYTDGHCIEIPNAEPKVVVDPTGCGDAYRGGMLYGLMSNMDWETIGRIASLMGALKIEQPGTQNHHVGLAEFEVRFKECYGRQL